MFRTALIAALLASPALASGPGEKAPTATDYLEKARFTYDVFESSVPHVDLENCPAEFDPEVVFCRMTLANDMANIFVFALDGDQPLMAVKHYELGEGFLPF